MARLRADCDELFAECLAFTEAVLVRGADLDDGLGRLADQLVEELRDAADAQWDRLTFPADAEWVMTSSQMIRIRFADQSVWHLPVAAHEFGHVLGPQLQDPEWSLPSRDRATPLTDDEAHTHEAFADHYAVYAMGPAFPVACVFLKFDATAAQQYHSTHPTAARRVYAMLSMLDCMGGQHADVADVLRVHWRDACGAAGEEALPEKAERQDVEDAAEMDRAALEVDRPQRRLRGS